MIMETYSEPGAANPTKSLEVTLGTHCAFLGRQARRLPSHIETPVKQAGMTIWRDKHPVGNSAVGHSGSQSRAP